MNKIMILLMSIMMFTAPISEVMPVETISTEIELSDALPDGMEIENIQDSINYAAHIDTIEVMRSYQIGEDNGTPMYRGEPDSEYKYALMPRPPKSLQDALQYKDYTHTDLNTISGGLLKSVLFQFTEITYSLKSVFDGETLHHPSAEYKDSKFARSKVVFEITEDMTREEAEQSFTVVAVVNGKVMTVNPNEQDIWYDYVSDSWEIQDYHEMYEMYLQSNKENSSQYSPSSYEEYRGAEYFENAPTNKFELLMWYTQTVQEGTDIPYMEFYIVSHRENKIYTFNIDLDFSENANNPKIGDEIGNVLNTDIKTYIDGYRIPSYNINNKSAVLIKDLVNYGFKSFYDDKSRMSTITNGGVFRPIPIANFEKDNNNKPGTVAFKYVYTDIVALVNGRKVESFNIKGNLAIFFEDIGDYGTFTWDSEKRESRFVSYKPSEVNKK